MSVFHMTTPGFLEIDKTRQKTDRVYINYNVTNPMKHAAIWIVILSVHDDDIQWKHFPRY